MHPQTESTFTLPEPFTAVCSSLPVCSSLTRVPVTLFVVLAVTGCLAALLSGCPSSCFYCLSWCLLSSVLLLPPTPLLSNCIPCFAALLCIQCVAATVCGACRARSELAAVECAVRAVAVGGSSPAEFVRCAMSWLLEFMMRPWNALSKVNCPALFRCDHVPQCPVRPCASRSSVRARQHNTRAHRRGSDLIVLIDPKPTKSAPEH